MVAEERGHRGLLLQALYPLGGKVPGLRAIPSPLRRATRRVVTAGAAKAHLARCRRVGIVAITGSRGKTTLKDLTACMLAPAGTVVRTRHNDNDLYGVPATLLSVRPDDRFAVVEVGIRAPGEMAWLAGLVRPRVAVLTGVGADHLEAFESPAALAREKRRLLERVPASGTVVVNAADATARAAARGLAARVVLAGEVADADVRLVAARLDWPNGLIVDLDCDGERLRAAVALHGLHLAPLVALALATARACGIPAADALAGAAEFTPPPGRLRPARGPRGAILLLDDAKSRPATALAAVHALAAIPAARRIAVIGELQEAGEGAYASLAEALGRSTDLAVAVGDAAVPLTAELGADRVRPVRDVTELAALLDREAGEDDAILLHGANAQHLQRAQLLLDGDEVGCRVRRCRLHWRCTDCPYLASGPPERVVEQP